MFRVPGLQTSGNSGEDYPPGKRAEGERETPSPSLPHSSKIIPISVGEIPMMRRKREVSRRNGRTLENTAGELVPGEENVLIILIIDRRVSATV